MTYGWLLILVLLSGCAKATNVCWKLDNNAHSHAEFGYFYDSLVVDVSGPATFVKMHNDTAPSAGNPCNVIMEPPAAEP